VEITSPQRRNCDFRDLCPERRAYASKSSRSGYALKVSHEFEYLSIQNWDMGLFWAWSLRSAILFCKSQFISWPNPHACDMMGKVASTLYHCDLTHFFIFHFTTILLHSLFEKADFVFWSFYLAFFSYSSRFSA
jgi:hypothetical protein